MKKWLFYSRYARSILHPDRPVVCHFFATERCNIRCPYCSVYKNPCKEVDLPSTKKIIDRVASMKVANFSITGGEPLVRKDICEIIEHACKKLPYVRITSNGTMPLDAYKRLLATPIDGMSISVDAVESDDPRHEKVIKRSYEVVDYLFRNKGDRRMNLSTTFHGKNAEELSRLIEFCAANWPGLKLFIQPAVVGKGSIRSEGERVDPKILFDLCRAPNVSNNEYFNDICRQYYSDPNFVFKCRAGRLFFGIRPDGAYWACHDVPTPLNILDEDFFKKLKALDLKKIADPQRCGSCIYSCYINLQKGIEDFSPSRVIRHFKDFRKSFSKG